MDIQRTILWVIFGMSLLFLWDSWQRHQGKQSMLSMPGLSAPAPAPKAGPAPGPVASGDVPAGASTAAVPGGAAPAGAAPTPGASAVPSGATAARAEPVRVETDLFKIDIDPVGAALTRAELLQQDIAPDWTAAGLLGLVTGKKHDNEKNVVLLEQNANRVYLARTGVTSTTGARYPNHLTPFEPLPGPRKMEPGQDTLEVKFAAEAGDLRVVKTYAFKRGSYAVDVTHELQNKAAEPASPSLYLQLVRDGNKPEGESGLYYTFTGPAVYTDEKKFQKLNFSDIEKKKAQHVNEAKDGWIAMIQHYFATAWVPPQGQPREYRTNADGANLYSVSTVMPLGQIAPGASTSSKASLWIGPQDQKAMAQLAPGLDLVVDYGWLTMISKPLFWLLQVLHGIVGNWGWAIVLLTVLIKAAFYPLSAASYRSMAKMKEVTPRLMKLREQYGEDKQKLNMAMMELYKNEKINPLGGCLPILVQIPVFIALYWVLLASVEMRNQPWILWVQDLATPDPWFILPVIMIASMWVQYKLNPTPPDPVQAKVMAVMPFIFGVMFFFFPAGLVLYWVVNNLLSIAQQWYVTKQIAKAKAVG
jgi:YidC/Oxa1 family membrane protein insertase